MAPYNLEDRTLLFSKNIIVLCRRLSYGRINTNLVDQLVRSATSVGANYREANETDTKKDFRNRIRISKKEAKETIYWLKLLLDVNPGLKDDIISLEIEATELMKILGSMYEKTNKV